MGFDGKTGAGVRVEGLVKHFGDVRALDGIDFEAPAGRVLGLLGHNGAGKTTAIRVLTTLTQPTAGRAWVNGVDVVAEPERVRPMIGLAGQHATVDGLMSGHANLVMVGRLYRLSKHDAIARANELLEQFDLVDAGDRLVKTFSGGMRRRLDIAASLVARPPVLFLDEPTTGLDPISRASLWALLRERVEEGATLVLTTQYLEEADQMADSIVVLDHGKVTGAGTPAELKRRVGGERLVVTIENPEHLIAAQETVARFTDSDPVLDVDGRKVTIAARPGTRMVELVRELDTAGVEVHDVHRREPTLDDVFITLTGTHPELDDAPSMSGVTA